MHCPPRPPDPPPPPSGPPPRARLPSSSRALSQPRPPAPAPSPARPSRPAKRTRDPAVPCARCARPSPATDLEPEAAPHRKRTGARISRTRVLAPLAALVATVAAPAGALGTSLPAPARDEPAPPARETARIDLAIAHSAASEGPLARAGGPTAAPRKRERAVVPRYSWVDGHWVEDFGWTLYGRGTAAPSATLSAPEEAETGSLHAEDRDGEDAEGGHAHFRTLASAMEDNLPSPTRALSSSPTPTSSLIPSASDTAHAADLAAQPSDSSSAARASGTSASFSIPDGWQAKPRETDYYAVPIIIAMSVLVAVIVVVSILVSVLMRRKKRRRSRRRSGKKKAKEAEGEKGWRGMVDKAMKPVRSAGKKAKKRAAEDAAVPAAEGDAPEGGGSSTGHRRVRTTGFAAGPRVRPRRRRRREGDGENEDDEGTALTRTGTRSSTSSAAHDTLTARLSARTTPAGATTVFSRDVTSRSQVSLTASALSRISSRTSQRSVRSAREPPAPPPEVLFTPADDPALTAHLALPGSSSSSLRRERSASAPSPPPAPAPPPPSTFGMLIATDALPAPGPPAYRPSSSTLQSTRRYGAGDAVPPAAPVASAVALRERRARRGFGRRREVREDEGEEEGEWHWPGEKGRPLGVGAVTGPSSPLAEPEEEGDNGDEAEEDQPPVDRALFSAHIATDDKAVLARLRAQRDRPAGDAHLAAPPSSAGSSSTPAPSAPLDEDDADVDGDGFERFDAGPSAPASAPPASLSDDDGDGVAAAPVSFLPAPPKPVQQPSYTYAYPRSTPSTPLTPSSTAPLLPPSSSSRKAALAAEYGAAASEDDVDALPRYLAGGGAGREVLGLASAPPPPGGEAESDEDELEYAEMGEVRRNEGEREEEGVV
ncbi:hypothetical protein JCM10450v2_003539 [Rhodotorula kratochvilovae]